MRTPSTWPELGLRGASAVAALVALGFGMAAAIAPADASKVGVAAAVNPDAFSSLSGTPTNQLNIGKSIFFNERIKTTDSGLVQVLLVDGSTFTVGPGSDLVIDKFVYNPKKGTGEITTTFSKGVVRYVGGKISKNADAVKMKTPAGALAIRGGMFQAKINGGGKGIFSFLYGVGLTFVGKNGQVYKVFQPGYTLDLTSGTPTIRPTTASDTNAIMKAFAKGGSGSGTADTGGNGGTKPGPNTNTTQASNTISEIINTFTQSQLQAELEKELAELGKGTPPPTSTGNPPAVGGKPPVEPCKVNCGGGGETPTLVNVRVVGSTEDAQVETFTLLDGHLTGKTPDGSQLELPWFDPDQDDIDGPCSNGICNVHGAKLGDQPLEGVGYSKLGFFAYQLRTQTERPIGSQALANDLPTPNGESLLAFGGQAYEFEASNGDGNKLYKFDVGTLSLLSPTPLSTLQRLKPDLLEVPDAGRLYASPLQVLDNSNEGTPSGVWLHSGFFMGEEGTDSLISVSLGDWSAETGLKGYTRVGMIELGSTFGANAASLAGPDDNGALSHFMGVGKPNVVLGTGDSTHVGLGTEISSAITHDRSYNGGFAAGLNDTGIVGNLDPNDVTVSVHGDTNEVTASLKVGDGAAQNPKYQLQFGGPGRSAAIDNNNFAAVEAESGSSVDETVLVARTIRVFGIPVTVQVPEDKSYPAQMQGFLVSADAIKANEILFGFDPDTKQPNKRAFCDECEFMRWGAWGAQVSYTDHKQQSVTKSVPLGWWIAGDVVPSNMMPKTGVATYTGDAVGNVRNGTSQYLAKGEMTMGWDFARRGGLLSIQNFDNKNFTALMAADRGTPQKFNGIMAGSNGAIGAANGAFVGAQPNRGNPLGVMGNFGVAKPGYQATGIYGGVLRP